MAKNPLNFQDMIMALQQFWSAQNCAILQPYDIEVGAGTSHLYTSLFGLSRDTWNIAYVQPSRRPTDGRYGENPNRVYQHHQFQVILKPAPSDLQQLYLKSLEILGIDTKKNDIRFVEDDWENPTLGAWGLGWEVWLNGMEITQFTFMQQIGGLNLEITPSEITYGLERLAMFVQDKDNVYELEYSPKLSYGDIRHAYEKDLSGYCLEHADTDMLLELFGAHEREANNLLKVDLPLSAYEQALKCSNYFNLLDARGKISVTERASYIVRIRNIVRVCCESWLNKDGK